MLLCLDLVMLLPYIGSCYRQYQDILQEIQTNILYKINIAISHSTFHVMVLSSSFRTVSYHYDK